MRNAELSVKHYSYVTVPEMFGYGFRVCKFAGKNPVNKNGHHSWVRR
jgi:hypothetical protein